MIRGKNGFSLIETVIAASTLLVVVLMILPQFTKNRQTLSKLQSGSSCDQLASFFLTNIGSRKNAVPVRNFYVNTDNQFPTMLDFTGDMTCDGTPCDRYPLFRNTAGVLEFNNYQNIRSAATWAGFWWDSLHPAGNCTATREFSASGVPRPLTDLANFLPQTMAPGEITSMMGDVQTDRLVDRVRFEITQLGAIPADCAAGVQPKVRPNMPYSFDIKVTVDYRKKDMRGPANNGTPATCNATTNVSYGFDRDPPVIRAVASNFNGVLPTVFVTTPPIISTSCNPTASGANTVESRVVQIEFLDLEAGSTQICKADIYDKDGNPVETRSWDVCERLQLQGINPIRTALTNPSDGSNLGRWSFTLQWGQTGANPKLPLNRRFVVTTRAVDTARNCDPANGSACPLNQSERVVDFSTIEYCPSVWLQQYCPGELVPTGCATNCASNVRKDFTPTCPAPDTYFACEDSCGRCNSITGRVFSPSCVTAAGYTARGNQPGVRDFTQVPGDNFCPPQNSYCAGTPVQAVPCGGPCPVGTKNESGNYCPSETDTCGNQGTKACTGPPDGAGRVTPNPDGSENSPAPSNPGCAPGYVPYCPPANTYCGNTIFLDQCGVPCPDGTRVVNCCDRCNSAIGEYEDMADCMNPANYPPLFVVPPGGCSAMPLPPGPPVAGGGRCFKPNP